jgi:capsular exopolysaccharide synthesis family protein
MRRLKVEPVRLSQLVRVSFESADAELAAHVANTIAETYIDNDTDARLGMNRRAGDWLGSRLPELKRSLEDSERALQSYRERAHIVETKGLAQSGASRQIEDLMPRLVAARQRRSVAQHAYEQVNTAKGQADTLPAVMRNPLVLRMKELENEAERRVLELSGRYGPEHPRLMQAQADLEQARANTKRQADVVVASLVHEYELARANEQALERRFAEAKASVQVINRKEFDLAALERAVATNRQIYELFLNRFRETRAARDLQPAPIARLTDEARPADLPVKPQKEQLVSLAFVCGVLVAALAALLLERLQNTVKSIDDVEDKLDQPLLTALPLLHGSAAQKAGRHYLQDPSSIFSEAIRTARTGLLLSTTDTPHTSVLVTSSVAGEGKTTVAINLALAQAHTKRVLLVDADLRRPMLARELEIGERTPGLTDLLSGSATFAQCLQRVTGTGLYVLTSGPVPLNPLELMMSQRFRQLMKALAGTCDMLIIDSPPVHLVSDALVLSKLTSGVVFVVKAESTPYPLARRCIDALRDVDADVFGTVLNQLDFRKADRYYGSYTRAYRAYEGYHANPANALSGPAAAGMARS